MSCYSFYTPFFLDYAQPSTIPYIPCHLCLKADGFTPPQVVCFLLFMSFVSPQALWPVLSCSTLPLSWWEDPNSMWLQNQSLVINPHWQSIFWESQRPPPIIHPMRRLPPNEGVGQSWRSEARPQPSSIFPPWWNNGWMEPKPFYAAQPGVGLPNL